MNRLLATATLFIFGLAICQAVNAQEEGAIPTQAIVTVDSKSTPPADNSAITVYVNDHKEPVSSWAPVTPPNAQVAVLIDSALRESIGRELDNFRKFVRDLPPGVEVLVGYMQFGHVVANGGFTTDHETAASSIRLPEGMSGMTASPYFCLSDFVKKWPRSSTDNPGNTLGATAGHKARFVIMITNGVDLYNGSTSIMNQDSPYVQAAISDAQRAGVAVYSIYYGEAGVRGGSANFSGQSYLQELTHATGGENYWEGAGNPVSTAPFFEKFQHAIAESYIATFNAPARHGSRDLVPVRFSAAKAKLHAPDRVVPGNQE